MTTSEASPPYEVIGSHGKPVGPQVIMDHHQQPRPHPHHTSLQDNVSVSAVPLPPTDVEAVRQHDGSVLIRWTASSSNSTVDYYTIQYRTVGDWLPLVDRLSADTTSHVWSTASRGVVYDFRLISVSRNSGSSLPSNAAVLAVDGLQT